jgi:hypothetical protein
LRCIEVDDVTTDFERARDLSARFSRPLGETRC